MGLLCSSFVLEPISHGNHIIRKKAELLFSKLHFWIRKLPLTNFRTKVELPIWSAILPSYPRLRSTIFIADVFHTIADTTSIIFDLCRQFFADAKIFELERLSILIETKYLYIQPFLFNHTPSKLNVTSDLWKTGNSLRDKAGSLNIFIIAERFEDFYQFAESQPWKVNTFAAKGFSETRPFMHLSKHVFGSI